MSEIKERVIKLKTSIIASHKAVELLCNKMKEDGDLDLAFRINCSLSIEYMLKFIALLNGKSIKKAHNLDLLFKRIGSDNLNVIGAEFEETYKSKLRLPIEFKAALKKHANDFIRWRYLDEFTVEELKNDNEYLHSFMHSLERILFSMYSGYLKDLIIDDDYAKYGLKMTKVSGGIEVKRYLK